MSAPETKPIGRLVLARIGFGLSAVLLVLAHEQELAAACVLLTALTFIVT